MAQHIVTFVGPLPATATFTTESSGPASLFVAGSVWTEQAHTLIGIAVSLDGQSVGDATIWSNGPGTHRAVVPATFNVNLDKQPPSIDAPPPSYTVTLSPLNGATRSDLNDNYSVVLSI